MAWLTAQTLAFPPAPPHQIFGLVRDQLGNPLDGGALVILEATSGVRIRGDIALQSEPGVNYRLEVPLDSGLTSDLYSPTALRPTAPFTLRVQVGTKIYLPMEMNGDLSQVGLPGQRTRIDLTLGVDADGNGLPDGWEQAVASFLRRPWVAGSIRPGDIYPGTGMSYRDVYLTGIYALDPKQGMALEIVAEPATVPKLVFTVVKGRSYTIEAAAVLNEWKAVPFRIAGSSLEPMGAYQASATRRLEIEAPELPNAQALFYRLKVH